MDIDCGRGGHRKLRLWLSLVVDEDDFLSIKPLPNLDIQDRLREHPFWRGAKPAQRPPLRRTGDAEGALLPGNQSRQKKEEKARIERLIRQLTDNDERFDFEIYFSEVFHEKRGFDVVIANPPYVRQESIKAFKPQLKQSFGNFYCGTADLYTYFYKRGLEILKPVGHLCFIAPNKFMRAGLWQEHPCPTRLRCHA